MSRVARAIGAVKVTDIGATKITGIGAMKIIDIGANLTDPVFRGQYRGKQAHEDDMVQVLDRARAAGVVEMMVTGGSLGESTAAVQLSREHPGLFATVGCHPTRSSEPGQHTGGTEAYFAELQQLIEANRDKVVAVGECGLDYDRLHFAAKDEQQQCFQRQFALAEATGLPMFLHNRNTGDDFVRMVRENRRRFTGGVVHSFTGSSEEAHELLDLGLYIGINGCSLKTEENLAVAKAIPAERLMVETDCPYCEIRPTHASYELSRHGAGPGSSNDGGNGGWKAPEAKRKERWTSETAVKGRNEPCMIRTVVTALARLRGVDEAELAQQMYDNTRRVFFPEQQAR
ncbi:hypothetical protein GGF46_003328 [Coemansia sp. RSA 552]|nr:hypothetical protein GGF46_003328 [Coemansia sp. RSA 552]